MALATNRVDRLPQMHRPTAAGDRHLPLPYNAFIGTIYKDGEDFIGTHHDKMSDIDENGWIVVHRLGASRAWEIHNDDGNVLSALEVHATDAIYERRRQQLGQAWSAAPARRRPVRQTSLVAQASPLRRGLSSSRRQASPPQRRRREAQRREAATSVQMAAEQRFAQTT